VSALLAAIALTAVLAATADARRVGAGKDRRPNILVVMTDACNVKP
jgi:hypothetical protein